MSKPAPAGRACAKNTAAPLAAKVAASTIRRTATPFALRSANVKPLLFQRRSHHARSPPIHVTGCPMALNSQCGYPAMASIRSAERASVANIFSSRMGI